jgi:hypothetical protein
MTGKTMCFAKLIKETSDDPVLRTTGLNICNYNPKKVAEVVSAINGDDPI